MTVNVVGGINDDKIIAAIRGGNAPDVVELVRPRRTSASTARPAAGSTCGPCSSKDHIEREHLPEGVAYYTQYKGKRCALPLLADTYGLYYNKTLFKKAGIRPAEDVRRADRRREEADEEEPGRVAQGRRLRPVSAFYAENARRAPTAALRRASGSTRRASRSLAKDPGLGEAPEVAEEPDRLVRLRQARKRWQAGAGDEFSASNAFETGKLAMDDRRRVARRVHRRPSIRS